MRKASAVRIAIIRPTDFLKRQPFGGASGFLENILPELGDSVFIYGIGINGTIPWQTNWIAPNIRFIAIADVKYPSLIPIRFKSFLCYLRYRKRILKSKPDILYIHSWESALAFVFCNRHVPLLFHQHGSANPMDKSKYSWARNTIFRTIFDGILKIIHKHADWIIVIDQLCLEKAKFNGAGAKISLLMNAVNAEGFSPNTESRNGMRGNFGLTDKEFVILFVGRVEEVKRVDRLLDSMAYLKSAETPFRLYLAGDGSLKKLFEDYVTKKRIQNLVTFLGYVSHVDLPLYYNMADVVVLSSEIEGVPMALLEALACGTPVIAPKVGGIPHFVSNRVNGLLLDEISPKALAIAIKEVCFHNFSRQVIANSVTPWSSARFVIELKKIVNNLIQKQKEI